MVLWANLLQGSSLGSQVGSLSACCFQLQLHVPVLVAQQSPLALQALVDLSLTGQLGLKPVQARL